MTELGMRVIAHVGLDRLPFAPVVPDTLAARTDRQDAFQDLHFRLYLGQLVLALAQRLRSRGDHFVERDPHYVELIAPPEAERRGPRRTPGHPNVGSPDLHADGKQPAG